MALRPHEGFTACKVEFKVMRTNCGCGPAFVWIQQGLTFLVHTIHWSAQLPTGFARYVAVATALFHQHIYHFHFLPKTSPYSLYKVWEIIVLTPQNLTDFWMYKQETTVDPFAKLWKLQSGKEDELACLYSSKSMLLWDKVQTLGFPCVWFTTA